MKKTRHFLPVLIIIGFAFIYSSGCTRKLTATFEMDGIGNLPAKNLPGNPSGDSVTYFSAIEPLLKVIRTPSDTTKRSLEFKSTSTSGITARTAWLGFRAISANFVKPVTFVWSARKNFIAGGPKLYIDCSDGYGIVAARIIIESNGDVILLNDLGTGNGDNVASLANDVLHTFLLTVNLSKNSYNVSILGATGGNVNINDHPLIASSPLSFRNPANPSVSFRFNEFSITQKYIIDEVFINRKD